MQRMTVIIKVRLTEIQVFYQSFSSHSCLFVFFFFNEMLEGSVEKKCSNLTVLGFKEQDIEPLYHNLSASLLWSRLARQCPLNHLLPSITCKQ